LKKSNYLIAILEDQTDRKESFQGFEIGAYLGRPNRDDARIAVIHDPAADPILPPQVQTVAATPETLKHFLSLLVGEITDRIGRPLNRDFVEEVSKVVSETANGIAEKFVGGIVSQVLVPTLTISLPSQIDISKSSILSAPIEADDYALRLLNLPRGDWTFADIVRATPNEPWINELIDNIISLVNGKLLVKAKHMLHTERADFIPTLHHIDKGKGRQLSFNVALVEFGGETEATPFFGRPIASDKWPEVFVAMPFSEEIEPHLSGPYHRDCLKKDDFPLRLKQGELLCS
jgi:hypothetical protein